MDYQVTGTQVLGNRLRNPDQGGARFAVRSMKGNQNGGALVQDNQIEGTYPDGAILMDPDLDVVGENTISE
jgi:hypothetical protein